MRNVGKIGSFQGAKIVEQRGVVFDGFLKDGDELGVRSDSDSFSVKSISFKTDSDYVRFLYDTGLSVNPFTGTISVDVSFLVTSSTSGFDHAHMMEPSTLSFVFDNPDPESGIDLNVMWEVKVSGSVDEWNLYLFRKTEAKVFADASDDIEVGDIFVDTSGNIVAVENGDKKGSDGIVSFRDPNAVGGESGYMTLSETRKFLSEGNPELGIPWTVIRG